MGDNYRVTDTGEVLSKDELRQRLPAELDARDAETRAANCNGTVDDLIADSVLVGIYERVGEGEAEQVSRGEQDKRLRAELAQGLGYFPASLASEDVARYREQIAERKAREEAGERDGSGPGGYMWRKWDHLKEERRRTEVETQGRASVADLYECE
jgi:hypothetical protein